MTKAELMDLIGKHIVVCFKDGKKINGKLGFADEFSEKYDYRKPNYFYVEHKSFKVSHIKKAAESEPQKSDVEKRKPCINYEDDCEVWAGCPCVYYKAESEE